MKRAIRALLFWGVFFSGYVAAGQPKKTYTEEEVLDIFFKSREYEKVLEGHIALQEQIIAELKGQLSKIYEPEMQLEASTGGSDIEKTKR